MGFLLHVPVSFILFVLCCASISAYIPDFLHGRPRGGFVRPPDINHLSEAELVQVQKMLPEEKWFDQRLDHFNPTDTRKWRQRYYETGPSKTDKLFVMIGGEGSISPYFNTQSMFASYAKTYGAACLQLEHRFYGKSHPTPNMTTENLRYLSSEQALSDLATFITAKKKEYSADKVVVFGGSYSGALAAWFRSKYPYVADGAVSTSAPILAQVNFVGYLEVVRASLNTFKPAHACDNAFAAASKALEAKLKTQQGAREIKKMFNLCKDIDITNKMDVYNMVSTLVGNIQGTVQYNKEMPGDLTIDGVCRVMTNTSIGTELQRYAKLTHIYRPSACMNFNYTAMIEDMKKVEYDANAGSRLWTYQTCAEFGYFQTTDSPDQPFGHLIPLEFYTRQCADIFGRKFTPKFIFDAVSATNINYGARHYRENRVVFVNGDIDPWHYLSITHKIPQDPVIYIHGTAHCANMYLPAPGDPPGLNKARKEIKKLIGQWLE